EHEDLRGAGVVRVNGNPEQAAIPVVVNVRPEIDDLRGIRLGIDILVSKQKAALFGQESADWPALVRPETQGYRRGSARDHQVLLKTLRERCRLLDRAQVVLTRLGPRAVWARQVAAHERERQRYSQPDGPMPQISPHLILVIHSD